MLSSLPSSFPGPTDVVNFLFRVAKRILSQTTGHLACCSSSGLTVDGLTIVTATCHITCSEHANIYNYMLCHNNPIAYSFTIYLKVGWKSQNVPMNLTIHHTTMSTLSKLLSPPPVPAYVVIFLFGVVNDCQLFSSHWTVVRAQNPCNPLKRRFMHPLNHQNNTNVSKSQPSSSFNTITR